MVLIVPVKKINMKKIIINLSTNKSFIWKIFLLKKNKEEIISNKIFKLTAKLPNIKLNGIKQNNIFKVMY